ncbi:hypothetical protein ME3_01240, partial [Bartonella melophagi K-2C]
MIFASFHRRSLFSEAFFSMNLIFLSTFFYLNALISSPLIIMISEPRKKDKT